MKLPSFVRLAAYALVITALTVGLGLVANALPGCAGKAIRDTAGTAVVNQLLEGDGDRDVNADVAVGISLGVPTSQQEAAFATLATFTTTIGSKDRPAIVATAIPLWPGLRIYAEAGISARLAAGTITGPNANARTERLRQFTRILNRLAERQ